MIWKSLPLTFFFISYTEAPTGLEADLTFWLEVQRYKALCHAQANSRMVQHKMKAMIACFFASEVPPAVTIGIPPELAEETIQKGRTVWTCVLLFVLPCGAAFYSTTLPSHYGFAANRVSRTSHCSPYVFRAAETEVFTRLFQFYQDFYDFRMARQPIRSRSGPRPSATPAKRSTVVRITLEQPRPPPANIRGSGRM